MAFSFEPLLAVFAGHIMAVLAGPEHIFKSGHFFSVFMSEKLQRLRVTSFLLVTRFFLIAVRVLQDFNMTL